MAIITATRPDPKYYTNITQLPDLSWSSDEMLLDDIQQVPPGFTSAADQNIIVIPGLRSIVAATVTEQAAGLINKYAPANVQRDALYTLSTTSSGTAHDNAVATMNWVTAVNSYRDAQIANVKTLNFNQLKAYVVPSGVPPWPAPPAFLTPTGPATSMTTRFPGFHRP
jgi:hypothetical protein